VDLAIEEAFDARQRFEDDDELDDLSMRIAYEDAIHAHGWTRSDYEYVLNRAPHGAEERWNEREDSFDEEECAVDGAGQSGEEAGEGGVEDRGGQLWSDDSSDSFFGAGDCELPA
jgi:hypothetical protein